MASIPRPTRAVWAASIAALLAGGCGVAVEDPSMYLTGTEEFPLTTVAADGGGVVYKCNPGKVLICHIPPGNPSNAHTICVGKPAVDPHLTQHGDSVGVCAPGDGGVPGGGNGKGDGGFEEGGGNMGNGGHKDAGNGGGGPHPDGGTCGGVDAPCGAAKPACCVGLMCSAQGLCTLQ